MYTNSGVTIYNKYYDFEKDVDVYQKTEVYGVFWNSKEGYIKHTTNNSSDDKATMYVPLAYSASRDYIESIDFDDVNDKELHFTMKPGDLVIEGLNHPDIVKPRELIDFFTITSVDFKNFGSPRMRHWVVNLK